MNPEERAQYWKQRALKNWGEAVRMANRAGWQTFGTYIDQPGTELEFDGTTEDGFDLWERPKAGWQAVAEGLLRKFANHRTGCGCFICRTLTEQERAALEELKRGWKP